MQTRKVSQCKNLSISTCLREGFRKLSSDRQTDRHDKYYKPVPRRFEGGQILKPNLMQAGFLVLVFFCLFVYVLLLIAAARQLVIFTNMRDRKIYESKHRATNTNKQQAL